MKSKKHIIALIVAIIAIALLFFAHHYGWGTVFETILLCISFLATSYLLFFDSFVKTLGEETAKMMVLEEKTTIEEQIRIGFSKLLEEHKADLAKKNIAFGADYTFYTTEQSKVCIELYRKLADFYDSAIMLTNIFDQRSGFGTVFGDFDLRKRAFNKSTTEVMDFFTYNRILLKEEFCDQILNFIHHVRLCCSRYSNLFQDLETKSSKEDTLQQLQDITDEVLKMRKDFDELADAFRKLIQPDIEKQ